MPQTKPRKDKRKRKKDRNAVFSLSMCFRVYDYAKMGLKLQAIAQACRVNYATMQKWRRVYPELQVAYSDGKKASTRKAGDAYHKYVFQLLPKNLKKVWRRLKRYTSAHDRRERVELMFAKKGEAVRKHLFIHAMTVTNFNITKACKLLNVNKAMYDGWIDSDPEFIKLVDEMKFHQKNFYQSKLIEACESGETSAIIFANRTFNADIGYGNKLEVSHSGSIEHKHVYDLEGLELPIAVLRQINDAITAKEAASQEGKRKERTPRLKDENHVNAAQCAACGDWAAYLNQEGKCDECAEKVTNRPEAATSN